MLSKSLGLACLFTVLPLAAFAQNRSVGAQPYIFLAPGSVSTGGGTILHVGGGVDVVHRSGFGGGGEFGYVGGFPDGFDYGIGLLSYGASYRWLGDDRVVPFVNGGVTTVAVRGRGNAWHAGGGVDYWIRDGFGLRLELRDHIPPDGSGHLWGARFGFSWAPGGRVTR
jgi:hypothetical protein